MVVTVYACLTLLFALLSLNLLISPTKLSFLTNLVALSVFQRRAAKAGHCVLASCCQKQIHSPNSDFLFPSDFVLSKGDMRPYVASHNLKKIFLITYLIFFFCLNNGKLFYKIIFNSILISKQ